ncbi:MAG: DUF167 domain-containing protein [Alphaproteobacteria bacterium]|nr:DUF167 domain-containing protein [Alphaproteobacteria bacterium]
MATQPDGTVRLRLRVRPRARRTAVEGMRGDALKVHLQAPPVDGAANEALLRWLAKEVLGVRPAQVRLVAGATSRDKVVEVDGLDAEDVAARLRCA